MTGGFYQPRLISPAGIALVALLHGAAITALLMVKMEMPIRHKYPPIIVQQIPDKPPPPQHPVKQPPKERSRETVTTTLPPFPIKNTPPTFFPPPPPPGPPSSIGTGTIGPVAPPPPLPKVEPVRTGPSIDPRSLLQPPYPPALEREGVEGEVTVRVLIGADGRVRSVEKMSATRDDFFLATERHALRNWRFRPATIDGRPVESSKVMLLRFQLNG
jgi:protein TonB